MSTINCRQQEKDGKKERQRERERDNSCLIESGSLIKLNWQKSVSRGAVARIQYKERHARACVQRAQERRKENRGICLPCIHISCLCRMPILRQQQETKEQWKARRGSNKRENLLGSPLLCSMLIGTFKCHVDLRRRRRRQ